MSEDDGEKGTRRRSVPAPAPVVHQGPAPTADAEQGEPALDLHPAQVDRFLELTAQELTLRAREMEIRSKEVDHNLDYAKASLEAQVLDRESERKHQRKGRREWYVFIGAVMLLLLGALIYMLYLGKDVFAGELLKAILYVTPAGAGGYFLGKSRRKREEDSDVE